MCRSTLAASPVLEDEPNRSPVEDLVLAELTGIRQGMRVQSIYEVVEAYGRELGTALAPKRRAPHFCQTCSHGPAPVEQIQLSLGHASIQTTERYLGVAQNLTDAPCDHLGIRGPGK